MIKLTLAVLALLFVALAAEAATVNCTMDYPNGQHAGTDDGAIFYPNGTPLRTTDGEMQYPNGGKFLAVDGAMNYPNGSVLKNADGSMQYQSGAKMRNATGDTFKEDGSTASLAIVNAVVDPSTKLIVRAFPTGSSFRLYLKTDGNSLIVNIDDDANVTCEFVKPIGH